MLRAAHLVKCPPKYLGNNPKGKQKSLLAMLWLLETTDIKSAFLQGDTINREVYVKPPREAKLEKGFLWKLGL